MKNFYATHLTKHLLLFLLLFGILTNSYGQTKKQIAGKVDPRLLNLEKKEQFAPPLPLKSKILKMHNMQEKNHKPTRRLNPFHLPVMCLSLMAM